MRWRFIQWRARVRRSTAGRIALKAGVAVVGAFFVLVGLVLIVLPGPLTIPPILLGLYIWSTEFEWALRLRVRATARARQARVAGRARPIRSAVGMALTLALVIAGGLYLAASGLPF